MEYGTGGGFGGWLSSYHRYNTYVVRSGSAAVAGDETDAVRRVKKTEIKPLCFDQGGGGPPFLLSAAAILWSTGKMDRHTRNLFKPSPNELIANILAMLYYLDLASCYRVCKRTVDIIRGSALLQYYLDSELGRSGMEDSPLSLLSTPERRERLRVCNDSWKHLRHIELPTFDGHTYDIDIASGGVLTFCRRSKVTTWITLLHSWTTNSFSFVSHQYALDLSEDILKIFSLYLNDIDKEDRFHFLSLTTGEPHPRVADPLHSESNHFHCSNYLAILDPMDELCVCNWKTGQIVLGMGLLIYTKSSCSDAIQSMLFLPDNYFLLATTRLTTLKTKGYWDDITLVPPHHVLLVPVVSPTSHIDGAAPPSDNVAVVPPIQITNDTVAVSEDALICQYGSWYKPWTYLLVF
ncbi:hypothetical protein BJY52DRAFT_1231378 [Lactarius psammicola]|nr:hypothetical protein BJY52DRAFT_1231378 [Lactarius psammicola]